jgi:hypothetical protein
MAHGGSLTINPETGLPEAGFLDRMLPTIIGAGLTIASGGALSPLMAAGITGAGYGLYTGSLSKGLMAGLGAYGGAGLASGLGAAGAEAAGAEAASAGAASGETAANLGSQGSAFNIPADKFTTSVPAENVLTPGYGVNNSIPGIAGTDVNTMANSYLPSVNPVDNMVSQVNAAPALSDFGGAGVNGGVDPSLYKTVGTPDVASTGNDIDRIMGQGNPRSYWDNVKGGFGKATDSWEGLKGVWDKTPTGTGLGLMTTGMGLMEEMRNKNAAAPEKSEMYLRPYEYSIAQNSNAYAPNAATSEREYFVQPRFKALPIERVAKEGGLMSINKYGIGGEIEQMSAENSVSGNTMYPQSQLQTAMYSNPMVQRPVQNEVINAGLDTPVDTYTGEARMASGGVATPQPSSEKKYAYDPETMKFTETTTTTPAAQANQGFGLFGLNPMMGGNFRGQQNISNGAYFGLTPALMAMFGGQQQAAQQPTVTTETFGGIATPYVPQGQAAGAQDTSMVPNTVIPAAQTPEQQLGLTDFYANMNQRLAEQGGYAAGGMASGGMASGGISTLGGYSDGGRLLKGPGDGVSDSIPASIGDRQPARLADGEFVVPARIVSELGNGSTEAGARKLYQMMERVQHARRKTVGKNQVAKNNKAEKLMPA